jgi:hypothetical protein
MGLQYVAYQGHREQRDSVEILYRIAGAGASEPGAASAVTNVVTTRLFATWDIALESWRELVSGITALHGRPARCAEIEGASRGRSASWDVGGTVLIASARQPLDTGNEIVPNRVGLTYSTERGPANPLATPKECREIVEVQSARQEGAGAATSACHSPGLTPPDRLIGNGDLNWSHHRLALSGDW